MVILRNCKINRIGTSFYILIPKDYINNKDLKWDSSYTVTLEEVPEEETDHI